MKNKRIELKPAIYVDDWSGDMKNIHYTKVKKNEYGSQEDAFLIQYEDGTLEIISSYSKRKIFDKQEEAILHHNKVIKERKEWYQEQIDKYKKSMEELS